MDILNSLGFDNMEREVIERAMVITEDKHPVDFVFEAVIRYASELTGETI